MVEGTATLDGWVQGNVGEKTQKCIFMTSGARGYQHARLRF